jgi:hypothetical protein
VLHGAVAAFVIDIIIIILFYFRGELIKYRVVFK